MKPLNTLPRAANASWNDDKKHYETQLFVSNNHALVFVEFKAKFDKSIFRDKGDKENKPDRRDRQDRQDRQN